MGSKDQLYFFFFKGHICSGVEHVLTMINLKLKPSLFTPRLIIVAPLHSSSSHLIVHLWLHPCAHNWWARGEKDREGVGQFAI